ncbi:MAG: hypothetical protein H7A41_06310 [Chlamydiales bacterium]|nr:hypothetical protein [Chlamydiales bacterium]
MGAPLSFSAACGQLGNAAYGVVSAAWRAPFTGGKIRMVTVGIPVLFVTAATGAVIYAVMTTILGAVYSKCRSGTHHIYKRFFENTTVRPIYPNSPRDQDRRIQRSPVEIPLDQFHGIERRDSRDSFDEVQEVPVIITPLPPNAAKERNEALLKFLDLVDRYLIDPWVIKNKKLLSKAAQTEDPFLKAMMEDPGALRSWLRSIALWQLGVQWDQLETKYVKMETPAPPTLKTLELQVRAAGLEEGLRDALIEQLKSVEEGRVGVFQHIVTHSKIPSDKQLALMGISLQFAVIVREEPIDELAQSDATEKIRTNFAMIMHHGMAISMTQTSVMIEGWMAVIQQMSSHSPRLAPREERQDPPSVLEDHMGSRMETAIERLVKRTSAVLSGELSRNYLLPLWAKQQGEWELSIGEALGKEGVEERSTAYVLVNRFMNEPRMTEAEFLLVAESYGLSTSLTSKIAFFRSIRMMQAKGDALVATIQTLPVSLLLQVESVFNGTLHKSAKMMSEINLATTVPRVVNYALDLLGCCRAMQAVREKAEEFEVVVPERVEDTPLMLALAKGGQDGDAEGVQRLCLKIPEQPVTGQAVIERLGPKAHKAVRLSQPEIQERTWIHTTKERLEGLLRVKAAEYTREPEGQWLATLLKSKPNGNGGTSLIGSLLSLQNKLWKLLPGAESVAKILVMGVQTFIEEEACEGVQKQLNELTSTGFLSATIGKTLVKGLVDQSKEARDWKANLPLLQQVYAFLQPEEQKSVLKHLSAQWSDTRIFDKRRSDLMTPPVNSQELNEEIARMKHQEGILIRSLEAITKAYKVLVKDEAGNRAEIAALKEAYGKIKREKDLKQFARIKGLVIHFVDVTLEKKLNFPGGGSLKQIILAVIHEVYTLLSYQEVVKHWIFTIVDLLLDELEEATSPTRALPDRDLARREEVGHSHDEITSMLDFIPEQQQRDLLVQLCKLMETSSKQEASGWLSVGAWMKSGARLATNWVPGTVWGYIEQAFKDDLRITPPELTNLALKKFEAFATDPTGLADSVIQALVESVADPRPEEYVRAQEEFLSRSFIDLSSVRHDEYESKSAERHDGASSALPPPMGPSCETVVHRDGEEY